MSNRPARALSLWSAFATVAVVLLPTPCVAQAFPTQPVKFIVSTTPGAGMDAVARLIGERLSAMWGTPVVVENKPGGAGGIAATTFRLAADQHTFLVADLGVAAINPILVKNLGYEPRADFKPVTDLFATSFHFLVRSDRHDSLGALIKSARAKPDQINYGSSGPGSGQRLSVEMFKRDAGVSLTYIPYKGNSEALAALLSGDVDLVSVGLAAARGQIEQGKLRSVGTTGDRRSTVLPDVPTVAAAAGLAGFSADTWVGLFAHPKTPDAVVSRVQADLSRLMATPEVQAFYKANDYQLGGSAPDVFRRRIEADREKYRALIESARIKIE